LGMFLPVRISNQVKYHIFKKILNNLFGFSFLTVDFYCELSLVPHIFS